MFDMATQWSEGLEQRLRVAHAPTLLMTTAHLVGDYSLLRREWQPRFSMGASGGGYGDDVAAAIRETCAERLRAFLGSGAPVPPRPNYDVLSLVARWLMGKDMDASIRVFKNRLLFNGDDPCAPSWSKQVIAPGRAFQVVIIGAGPSGLLVGYRLKQAGVPFVILEKNPDVGGVWENNRYPGARVDLNSFVYSYAFAQKIWNNYFAERGEIAAYFREFAREHGLYEHVRLNTEVESCTWDEGAHRWDVAVKGDDGVPEHGNVVVSAVGQLSQPKDPDTPGWQDFKGPQFHSAHWDDSVELAGKRIGVIGNAASAMQFIPQIAKVASSVTVFMRTANWLYPQPLLHEPVGDAERWLMENLPNYAGWYRAFEFIPQLEGALEMAEVDPDYPPTEVATSAANAAAREQALAYIERQIADRPDLRPFLVPDHPFTSKRFVFDNGTWIKTLKRDNVTPTRSRVERIDADGVVTADGLHHDLDVLVYGIGFKASDFLMPMDVIGRDGTHLHDKWDGDARAYLGMTVPEFPNFFCLYGPNTNLLVHLSSIINMNETLTGYIVDGVRFLLESGANAIDVREDVYDSYNHRVDAVGALRTWEWSGVSSWYKNSKGRSAQNYPFSAVELAQRAASIDRTDFVVD